MGILVRPIYQELPEGVIEEHRKALLERPAGVRNVRAMRLGVWPSYRCGVCSYQRIIIVASIL